MKQNKFRRKELPHLREETPFEPSNLNQKLEVSYVFLVSSRVLNIYFPCGGGGPGGGLFVSSVHTTCAAMATNTITDQLLIEYIFIVYRPLRHFDLFNFHTYQHFWKEKKKLKEAVDVE